MYFSYFSPALIFIIPLFGIASLVVSLFRLSAIRLTIICLFTVLIIAELISIYFSGGFVDYQFFVNLNMRDMFAGMAIFKQQAILAAISFLIVTLILFVLAWSATRYIGLWLRLLLLMVFIYWVSMTEGPLVKLFEIYQITTANRTTFKQSIEQLSMLDYVYKSSLKAEPGKNIVVISLESFERAFLDDPLVTPNLRKILTRYTYFPNMPMSMGSSWTVASMYTYMTGIPFLIGSFSSSPMDNMKKIQLISLGDVLKKADYQMRYVMSNPDFSAMGRIISTFGIDVVSEGDYIGQYPIAPFGLYDRDIFDIARREITSLSSGKTPFALFISTISTHAPSGFKDERMTKYIHGYQNDNMRFAAASLDYNLAEFISWLEKSHLLKNTVFYIFPDHLMMGATAQKITSFSTKSRSLYVITSVSAVELNKQPDDTIYQIDLPRLILKGAKVRTNAKFLTDYLDVKCDKNKFISENKGQIATLNKSAIID